MTSPSLSSSSSALLPSYEGCWADIPSTEASRAKCDCGAVVLRFTFPYTRHTVDNVARNESVDSCERGHAHLTTTTCRDNMRLIKTVRSKLTDLALLSRLPPFRRAPPPPPRQEIKRPTLATAVVTSTLDETRGIHTTTNVETKDATLSGAECATYLQTVRPLELPEGEINRSNVVAIGTHCYVFGGCRVQSNRAMRYDTLTRAWQTMASMPRTFMRHALAATAAGEIVVVGGLSDRNLLNCHRDAYLYTPATNTWQSLPDMPYVVAYHSAVVYRDPKDGEEQLLVLGGVENPETYPLYRSGVAFGFRAFAWRSFDADMIKCRMSHTTRAIPGGVLRVSGGRCADKTHAEATACADDQGEEYDFSTRAWSLVGTVAKLATEAK